MFKKDHYLYSDGKDRSFKFNSEITSRKKIKHYWDSSKKTEIKRVWDIWNSLNDRKKYSKCIPYQIVYGFSSADTLRSYRIIFQTSSEIENWSWEYFMIIAAAQDQCKKYWLSLRKLLIREYIIVIVTRLRRVLFSKMIGKKKRVSPDEIVWADDLML